MSRAIALSPFHLIFLYTALFIYVRLLSWDDTLKLWKLDGTLLRTIKANGQGLTRVAFVPNGNFLVSGGDDGTVIMWDLKQIRTVNELDYACNWVRDYLRTNVEVEESDRHLCDRIRLTVNS